MMERPMTLTRSLRPGLERLVQTARRLEAMVITDPTSAARLSRVIPVLTREQLRDLKEADRLGVQAVMSVLEGNEETAAVLSRQSARLVLNYLGR